MTKKSMVRAMCGVLLRDRKRSIEVMFILGLNETVDQLAQCSLVRTCVEERGWSCLEKGIRF